VVSTVVSLTITPMICAHYVKETTSSSATWLDRVIEGALSRIVAFYERTLHIVLDFPFLTLVVFFATIALTVTLYIKTPKGYFPVDDSGFVIGSTRASPDISFQTMLGFQQRLADIVLEDPAVAGIGSVVGGGYTSNRGTMYITLKPPGERGGSTGYVKTSVRSPVSACSCLPPRTSAPAAGRAIPTISTRCRAPISTCCRNGRRWSPSAWRPSRALPTSPPTAIPAGCN
jgi:multidrug efflux pump subunit AcrB